jgi:hypothetical protein
MSIFYNSTKVNRLAPVTGTIPACPQNKKHKFIITKNWSYLALCFFLVVGASGMLVPRTVQAYNDGLTKSGRSEAYLLDKVITWADGSTEHVQIDTDGWFYLNGVKQKLVGFCDSMDYAAGWYWDAGNLAILENELQYFQSVGGRLWQPNLFPAASACYIPVLDLLYKYKMLVMPCFTTIGEANFNSLTGAPPNGTDFVIGEQGEGTVSTKLAGWVNTVKTYSNVVALIIENEIDIDIGNHNYTLANAQLYMDLVFATAAANTTLPLMTKFGNINSGAFAKSIQDAFISRYGVIPCFDVYGQAVWDFAHEMPETRIWCNEKGKTQQLWITEFGYSLNYGYDATLLTKEMVDTVLAYSSIAFIWGVQANQLPDAMFFDAAGAPIANTDKLMANMNEWQAAISQPAPTPVVATDGIGNITSAAVKTNSNLTSNVNGQPVAKPMTIAQEIPKL